MSVCLHACVLRPQSLQIVGATDLRLHTLKPTDSSPLSIDLTVPDLCSPPHTHTPPTLRLTSLHPQPASSHQSFNPPPLNDLPNTYRSSVFVCHQPHTHCSIRTFSNMIPYTNLLQSSFEFYASFISAGSKIL